MATQTPNLNLKKPAGTDYVLVGDFNGNADALDATIGKMSELTTAVKTSLVLAINDANNRGTHPPYIGENNHWYEWDSATTQYVDSGVVAEGVDGNDGISAYVHIKWSATQPTSDSDMKATPDAYIGIYSGTNSTAPTAYTSYSWYQYKGAKGDTGTAGTGNNWYSGNAITGTSTTPTAYATGITLAQVGDMYMNTGALPDTGRVYKCTLGGNASTALWKYDVLLRGAEGDGTGDMLKSTYDTDNDGKVDSAEDSDKLGGVAASGYAREINGQAALTDLDDADYIPIYDSSATVQKKSLWSNIKSVLKTYFDTLYQNSVGTTNGILKANGSGTISAATAGTDYLVEIVSDTTPQLGGELDGNGHSIGCAEYDNGNSGTSKAIDWRVGNHQKVTMTGNCTFTFTAPSKPCMLSLRIIQDATGSRTVTLPTMKKPGGTAFTHSTAANSIDILSIYYDGSAYYGQLSTAFS